MNWEEIKIWYVLSGLGIFLFGISFLEDAIKSLAGRTFKTFLQQQTGSPIKAVVAGAITTGVMQSSSMVTLLVMSFTGAGIIGLQNGIGMLLGANIGTTITGWIVALLGFKINIETFYLPLISAGSLVIVFSQNGRLNQYGKLVFGFGLMFMGLNFMKEGFVSLTSQVELSFLNGKPKILFLAFGIVLAASIRSSAAAMVIFLTSLSVGSINLQQAGYLTIGADLGTTITGILGTINGNSIRKKTGWSQFYINVITAIVTLILMHPLFQLIRYIGISDPLVALVSFHTLFNILGIIIILPFIGKFTSLIDHYISAENKTATKYLPFSNPKDVMTFLDALKAETLEFISKAIYVQHSFFIKSSGTSPTDLYFQLKTYENEIFNLSTSLWQNKLTPAEASEIQGLFSSIRSATLAVKDVKDIAHNLEDSNQSVNEIIFKCYNDITVHQKTFNKAIKILISHVNDAEKISDIRTLNESKYNEYKQVLFDHYHQDQNFDIASFLNMVREIRDSNELLIRSYEQYIQAKEKG